MFKIELVKGTTWSIDIDGTLTDYPTEWLNFIHKKTGNLFDSTLDAKNILGNKSYKSLKHDYRISDEKYEINIKNEAKDFIKKIKKLGCRVIISSSRPFETYKNMMSKTKLWLINNDVHFDDLISKNELASIKINYHIDNEMSEIERLSKLIKYKKNFYFIYLNQNISDSNNKFITNILYYNSFKSIIFE